LGMLELARRQGWGLGRRMRRAICQSGAASQSTDPGAYGQRNAPEPPPEGADPREVLLRLR
jgi:hypothetical protein